MRLESAAVQSEVDGMSPILLVSDDPYTCTPIRDYLEAHGFSVESAMTCENVIGKTRSTSHRTILIELGKNTLKGFDVLSRVREVTQLETIMLVGPGGGVERILALELGADDYLSRPFHFSELLARIRALHRTAKHPQRDNLKVDDIEMDLGSRTVSWRGHILDLTTSEFALLEALLRSAGQAVSRERLVNSVLARQFDPFDRSLDMLVSRLRKKLQAVGIAGRVKTVRSLGYQFATRRLKETFRTANIVA